MSESVIDDGAAATYNPRLNEAERSAILILLRESEQELLDAIADLNEEQWNHKPLPEVWSVGETAQHIVLTESALFRQIEKALATEPAPDWELKTAGKDELLYRILPQRVGRARSPEALLPRDELSRDEVVRRFRAVRAVALRFAEDTQAPLKVHTAEHPLPIFGTLSAYQWLLYIPFHGLRHTRQIEEVKSGSGFPV